MKLKGLKIEDECKLKMTGGAYFTAGEKEDYYEEEEEVVTPRRPGEPPDGGWGWLVVIGAFCCCLFTEGILFSFLVLKKELSIYYDIPEGSITFVGVLMLAFSLLGGPMTSALVKKFRCRKVVMAGSVVTCASLLVSTQMPNIALFHLTYGVLAGLGLSMVKLPAIMMVAFWFEKRRAFTTGLAVMGAGVGVFIFPPLFRHLLDIHDWKNATVILAALFLNCAAAGALFRPLTHAKRRKGMKRGPIQRGAIMKALIAEKERQRTISNGSLDNCIITRDNRLIKIDKIDLRNKSNSYINRLKETFGFSSRSLNRSKNSLIVPKGVPDPIYRPKSPRSASSNRLNIVPKPSTSPPTPKRDSGCGSLEGSPVNLTTNYKALPTNEEWNANLVVQLPPDRQFEHAATNASERTFNLDSRRSPTRHASEHLDPSFMNRAASPAGSVRSIHLGGLGVRSPSLISQTSKMTDLSVPMQGSVMTVPQSSYEMSSIEEEELTDFKLLRKVYRVMDLKLLKLPSFWLLTGVSCVTTIGYLIPLTHLPQKAMSLQISKEKSEFLISILWASNMIARVAYGWLADRPWASAIQLNNVMILLAGFLSLFGQFFITDSWLVFYAVFFGLFTATFFTLRSIMLIELLGKDKLAPSLGLLAFFQGLAALAAHEISSHLSVDLGFYIIGIMLVSAGLLGFLLPRVKRWEVQRENRLEVVHIEELQQEEVLQVENIESNV